MEKLKDKILKLYSEYTEFDAIISKKNKDLVDNKSNITEMAKGKSLEELEEILLHLYSDVMLYNANLKVVFVELITSVENYKEISEEELPEEVLKFYNNMKQFLPKRLFAIEKGEIVETEVGLLESQRKLLLEGDFFKNLKQQLSAT